MTVLVGTLRCRCTPPSLKRTPSASSAETTRCRARTPALGTLPLEPSQAVRQGREIEARSASSCCETPVRRALRATGNLDNRHVEIVCAASAHVNVSVLYQLLTPPSGLGLLASPSRQVPFRSGSASLGRSQKDGLPSCRAGRSLVLVRFGSRPSTRAQGGSLSRCPFLIGSGNGCQDAQPCFARRPVALLRRRRLDFGSPCFGFGLFRARRRRRSRDSLEPLALTWRPVSPQTCGGFPPVRRVER